MAAQYSQSFIEQALVKAFSRDQRSVTAVALDMNMSHHTLRYWMKKKSLAKPGVSATKEKRPQDWTAEEQLVALHETHGLTGEALHAWCRERGVFVHHLASWNAAFCAGREEAVPGLREMRTLKDEIAKLKRDVVRKDRALAEAAALLILQKKFRALWEDEA